MEAVRRVGVRALCVCGRGELHATRTFQCFSMKLAKSDVEVVSETVMKGALAFAAGKYSVPQSASPPPLRAKMFGPSWPKTSLCRL